MTDDLGVLNMVMRMQLCYGIYRDGQPVLEVFSEVPAEFGLMPKLNRAWLRRHLVAALRRPFQSQTVVKDESNDRSHYSTAA